jgi:hypothetical protein
MLDTIIGALLATTLLYIGRCWGQQGPTYHVTLTQRRRQG